MCLQYTSLNFDALRNVSAKSGRDEYCSEIAVL